MKEKLERIEKLLEIIIRNQNKLNRAICFGDITGLEYLDKSGNILEENYER